MTDFDEIAAASEVVKILCSGLGKEGSDTHPKHPLAPLLLNERRELAEALESVPAEKLRLLLKLMREKDDGNH